MSTMTALVMVFSALGATLAAVCIGAILGLAARERDWVEEHRGWLIWSA